MRRARDLEQRLTEWGREYGGSKYEISDYGNSFLASMMKWHGRPPSGLGVTPVNTAADEVQDAYEDLCKQEHGWLPAQVLRCEYTLPGQPVESKIQKLARFGEQLGRTTYFKHLRTARRFVADCLNIPYAALGDDDAE